MRRPPSHRSFVARIGSRPLAAAALAMAIAAAGATSTAFAAAIAPSLRCASTVTPEDREAASSKSPVPPTTGPEVSTGFHSRDPAFAPHVMAVTAQPLASRAACEILVGGGSAVDAAIAAQMVLNLVEPQSSGLGGGAFLLVYDAKTKAVRSYDGRETAPAAADGRYLRFVDEASDRKTPRPNPRASGRSIGVPGVLRMLELAHREHGRRPWATLFDPAIRLARDGFRI